MATVWAKNNGNWSATTLWAFWNETTQQIEDYNQVPQVGDVVYCNGYNISLNSSQIITCKEIHNGINPYTNNINGYIILRNGIIINADIYNDGTTYITYTATNNSGSFTINGNIYRNNNSSATCAVGGASGYIMTIVGNIEVMSNITQPMFSNSQAYPFNITVVGNVYMPNSSFSSVLGSASNCHIRIDGVCEISKPYGVDNSSPNYTFTCSGILIINSPTIAVITANKIHYRAGFNCVLSNVYPIDTATFECKYIGTEPNPNLYIIVNPNTIADTYPTEDKVLAPTQYGAQMELVGQYTPDYPPESVVLKDYEYGDSDDRKIGTMPVLSQQLISRLENCATVETVQQLLVAHLDN